MGFFCKLGKLRYDQVTLMIKIIAVALLTVLLCNPKAQAAPNQLFDGVSFAGWEGDTNKTFRIENGCLVGGTLKAPIPRNEFLCTTRSYTNFVAELDFKLIGNGANGGFQFRTQRIPNHHEVSGYQADLGDPAWWGCLYDESRRNKVLAKPDAATLAQAIHRDQWNHYKIRCDGKRIQIWLNGIKTVDYVEAEPNIPLGGIIGLQIHGGPASEAWYKNLALQILP